MRTKLLTAVLGAAALAALAAAAASPPQGLAVPAGAGVRAKEEAPLLGMMWNDVERGQTVVHVNPASLQALPEPSFRLGTYGAGAAWSFSPDGERLAVSTNAKTPRGTSSALQIVDRRTLRRQLALPVGYSQTYSLAWLEPDRLLAVRMAFHPERLEVLTVAPSARRVIARSELQGEIVSIAHTRDSLVLLMSPAGRIGTGTLVVASASGEVRSVPLQRVWIGTDRPDTHAEDYVARWRRPGFAADPNGSRAFVFPPGSDAAEVDLRTLEVRYHALAEPVSLFGRLRRFLDPVATAKAVDGPSRYAQWLGGGLVALTGADHSTWKDQESRLQMRSTPAGLTLVDTNTWRIRTIDRGASALLVADGVLLATGGTCDSTARGCTSMGLAAYDLTGARRFRLFEDRPIHVSQAYRGLAYVGENQEPLRIVELASGRIVGTRRDAPPWLLQDDASPYG